MDEDFFYCTLFDFTQAQTSFHLLAHPSSPSRPYDLLDFSTPLLRTRTLKVRTLSLFHKNLRSFFHHSFIFLHKKSRERVSTFLSF